MNPTPDDALDQIIEEGNAIEGLLGTDAWRILRRTIEAQIAGYREDCYEAAKDLSKNIGNYLGRMEALEALLRTIEMDFMRARDRALAERDARRTADREQAELDQNVTDHFSVPSFQAKPGTI